PVDGAGVSASDARGLQPAFPGSGTISRGSTSWRLDWRRWLMVLWALGTAVVFARMLIACAVMWRIRRSAKSFSDAELCSALFKALRMPQAVDVLEIEAGSMPMTFGVLRPTILMPSNAVAWTPERKRIV